MEEPTLKIVMSHVHTSSILSSEQSSPGDKTPLQSEERGANRINLPVPAIGNWARLPYCSATNDVVVLGFVGETLYGAEGAVVQRPFPTYPSTVMPLDTVFRCCKPYTRNLLSTIAESSDSEGVEFMNLYITHFLMENSVDTMGQTFSLLASMHNDDLLQIWEYVQRQCNAGDVPLKTKVWPENVQAQIVSEHSARVKQRQSASSRRDYIIEEILRFGYPLDCIVGRAIEQLVQMGNSSVVEGEHRDKYGPVAELMKAKFNNTTALRDDCSIAVSTAVYWSERITLMLADLVLLTHLHHFSEFFERVKQYKLLASKPGVKGATYVPVCKTTASTAAVMSLPTPCARFIDRTKRELYNHDIFFRQSDDDTCTIHPAIIKHKAESIENEASLTFKLFPVKQGSDMSEVLKIFTFGNFYYVRIVEWRLTVILSSERSLRSILEKHDDLQSLGTCDGDMLDDFSYCSDGDEDQY